MNTKQPLLLHWKRQTIGIFFRNNHTNNHYKRAEHEKNNVKQRMRTMSVRKALHAGKNERVTCRNGRVQTIASHMADLTEQLLNASTAFANDLFRRRTVRAVHIEVVIKLNTDSCLDAIMLFFSRRDKPRTMISYDS